jgi:hypothetical protein
MMSVMSSNRSQATQDVDSSEFVPHNELVRVRVAPAEASRVPEFSQALDFNLAGEVDDIQYMSISYTQAKLIQKVFITVGLWTMTINKYLKVENCRDGTTEGDGPQSQVQFLLCENVFNTTVGGTLKARA